MLPGTNNKITNIKINSIETSTTPIDIPAFKGRFNIFNGLPFNAVNAVLALDRDETLPPLEPEVKLFLGETCGCGSEPLEIYNNRRKAWTTSESEEGFYSINNSMMANLLHAGSLDEFFGIVYESIHILGAINRLEICVDTDWLKDDTIISNSFSEVGYSRSMINVLSYVDGLSQLFDPLGAADAAYERAKAYTDERLRWHRLT